MTPGQAAAFLGACFVVGLILGAVALVLREASQ